MREETEATKWLSNYMERRKKQIDIENAVLAKYDEWIELDEKLKHVKGEIEELTAQWSELK